jgi:hypothetical protein
MLFFIGFTIIPLFHLHYTTDNYSKTPTTEIEIIPSRDPEHAVQTADLP